MSQLTRRLLTASRWVATGAAIACATSASATPAVVPVRFMDGLPVVAVGLGSLEIDFLLDTGGRIGLTVPPPLINSATEVTLRDDFQKTGDVAGNVFSVQKLTASNVVLGGAQLGPVDGLVNYQWGLVIGGGERPEVSNKGTIGFGALSTRNVLFDWPAGTMTLYERGGKDRPDLSRWQRVPFEYDARGVVVKVRLNGVDAAMALDSAATVSAIKKDAGVFRKTPSPCRGKRTEAAYCGTLKVTNATSGGAKLRQMNWAVAAMGNLDFDGLIGSDFFRSHRVFIDFDDKVVYLLPVKSKALQ